MTPSALDGLVQLDGALHPLPHLDVEELDQHRKAHGEIDVALGDDQAEPFAEEGETDEEEEAQGQHLDGWVPVDELTDGPENYSKP